MTSDANTELPLPTALGLTLSVTCCHVILYTNQASINFQMWSVVMIPPELSSRVTHSTSELHFII